MQWLWKSEPTSKRDTKGLENPYLANNCFLNVAIQGLWHIKAFRQPFMELNSHFHESPCIFCSLRNVLVNYEDSHDKTDPHQLREALSTLYSQSAKFQLGEFDDATEVFVAILNRLHFSMTGSSDDTCAPNCLVHRIFGQQVVHQRVCSCGEEGEPLPAPSFIYNIYSSDLFRVLETEPQLGLESVAQQIRARFDLRKCPHCKRDCPAKEWLLSKPTVFSVGIAWHSQEANPTTEIGPLIDTIPEFLDLDRMFDVGQPLAAQFRGLICFYGNHYTAIFHAGDRYVSCDDSLITEVCGHSLRDVRDKCVRGHLQPTLLFFETDVSALPSTPATTHFAPSLPASQQQSTFPAHPLSTPKPKFLQLISEDPCDPSFPAVYERVQTDSVKNRKSEWPSNVSPDLAKTNAHQGRLKYEFSDCKPLDLTHQNLLFKHFPKNSSNSTQPPLGMPQHQQSANLQPSLSVSHPQNIFPAHSPMTQKSKFLRVNSEDMDLDPSPPVVDERVQTDLVKNRKSEWPSNVSPDLAKTNAHQGWPKREISDCKPLDLAHQNLLFKHFPKNSSNSTQPPLGMLQPSTAAVYVSPTHTLPRPLINPPLPTATAHRESQSPFKPTDF